MGRNIENENQLTTVYNNKFDVTVIDFVNDIEKKSERANSLVVDEKSYKLCEEERKEYTNCISDVESKLAEIEVELLSEWNEYIEPLKTSLKSLKDSNDKLQKRILETKKSVFKEKVRNKLFEPMATLVMETTGVIVDFEEVYEDKWYGKKESDITNWISAKLKSASQPNGTRFMKVSGYMTERHKEYISTYLRVAGVDAYWEE